MKKCFVIALITLISIFLLSACSSYVLGKNCKKLQEDEEGKEVCERVTSF